MLDFLAKGGGRGRVGWNNAQLSVMGTLEVANQVSDNASIVAAVLLILEVADQAANRFQCVHSWV